MAAEPIRDKETFDKVLSMLLRVAPSDLYHDAFRVGCYTGLRASDLLSLEYDQVFNKEVTKDKKTGKTNNVLRTLPKKAIKIIEERSKRNPTDKYVFQSKSNRNKIGPVSVRAFNQVLQEANRVLKFPKGSLSTHSMRKTMGYTIYKQTGDLALVCSLLNHSSIKETLRYIGITDKMGQDAKENLDF